MFNEEPFDLTIQLRSMVDLYNEQRLAYWDACEDVPMADFWREKADQFAEALVKWAGTLQTADELEEATPSDFWQEWPEQYDLETVKHSCREALIKAIQGAIRECDDEAKRKKIRSTLEFVESMASGFAEHALSEPPSKDRRSLRFVWERIAIELATEFSEGMLEESATRMLRLWALLARTTPSNRCLAFLGRVSRCYVWGFEPECITMCRSTLEAAFDAEVTTGDCWDIRSKRRSRRDGSPVYDLEERIQAAFAKGYINATIKEKADRLRKLGNAVVHRQPVPPQGPSGTYRAIRETLDVVQALCDRGAVKS